MTAFFIDLMRHATENLPGRGYRALEAFTYGPGLLSVARGPNELVERQDLGDGALICALTAARLPS